MMAALGSALDIGNYKGLSEQQIADRTDAILDSLPDLAGAFYKYSLAGSILGGSIR
jgi:F420-non-reducing hydrogenase small subunit